MKIATRRSEMTPGARQALNDLDAALADIFEVKTESLPEHMRDNRSEDTSFNFLLRRMKKAKKPQVDPRSVSVKFSRDGIESATPERLATLNKYREAIENGGEIEYSHINEDAQYENELQFCCDMAKLGVFNEEDFETEE